MLKEFARDLKFIREQKDISLKTISQKTRLNLSALESLEAGDFTFQPQTYIRAFIKQYAATLDLDVEEVLFDYDLARSGKYKPKFTEEIKSAERIAEPEEEPETADEPTEPVVQDKTEPEDEIVISSESEFDEEVQKKEEAAKENDVFTELPQSDNKVRIVRDKPKGKTQTQISVEQNDSSFKMFSSPVFRNIALIVVGLLIILGIYSLINIMFLDGKGGEPEVIRQNFDDVVEEQEKRILGKRTPEEIQDSIRKANEELAKITNDSLVLTVNAVAYGEIYVITDSLNYKNPKKVTYDEGEVRTFKAKDCFHITTANTESFSAKLNGRPLEFNTKAVRKVKITSDGVQN